MSTKLHLGCGKVILPGFINIDKTFREGVDDTCDIRYLHPRRYPERSADLIYASHVLEHFNIWEYESVLRIWWKILDFGGMLRLSVPDFEKTCIHYAQNKDVKWLWGALSGSQDGEGAAHLTHWDFDFLSHELKRIGFGSVHSYDWRKTEHSEIDDHSQAYFPHMDKENGMLMSLNVEAIK